jgi:hypothetical protein
MTKKFLVPLLFLASTAVFAAQSLTGVVTDSMCGKKHMIPGKSDAECIRECIKAKSKYALLVGDKLYTLSGDSKQLEAVAGKKVTVAGDVSGTTVTVKSIAAAK